MVAGEYIGSQAVIKVPEDCCNKGKSHKTELAVATTLVKACEPQVEYKCAEGKCTKNISTAVPAGEGAMESKDGEVEATPEDKEAICQEGIEKKDASLKTQCKPAESKEEFKWDEAEEICYRESSTNYFDGTEPPVSFKT